MGHITKDFIKGIKEIYECILPDVEQVEGQIRGTISDSSQYEKFKKFLTLYSDSHDLYAEFNDETLHLDFHHPEGTYRTLDIFLSGSQRRRKIPYANFYIRDTKEAYLEGEIKSNFFKNYEKICNLIKYFSEKCDFYNDNANPVEMIFLGKKKLIINDLYSSSDISENKAIDDFLAKNNHDDLNSEEKNKILKRVIIEFFINFETIEFGDVLRNIKHIYTNLINEFELYLSSFSYEAVRKEVEKEKADLIVRLNKVFSDIQTQLIGVPVSVIIAADKLSRSASGFNTTNILVILGILFYSIILTMLIRNQNNTLSALRDEIDHHIELLNTKHKSVSNSFLKSFRQVETRYDHQKLMLLMVDVLVSLALGIVFIIFFYYSFGMFFPSLLLMIFTFIIGLIVFYINYE
ncbi:hypothetical protein [Acinetobacter guillouiae]|uniref:hypothetical protein n=1 Tax=Acinetobacter guillouiae TaxID=106649 RepID=UPI001AE10CC3|nr:hypothetical protein [Acinetobacter guillouiae]MBP2544669.1 putative membrane protein YqjE [Acinetobacter guillouiae]